MTFLAIWDNNNIEEYDIYLYNNGKKNATSLVWHMNGFK